jgi:hypothetical protein
MILFLSSIAHIKRRLVSRQVATTTTTKLAVVTTVLSRRSGGSVENSSYNNRSLSTAISGLVRVVGLSTTHLINGKNTNKWYSSTTISLEEEKTQKELADNNDNTTTTTTTTTSHDLRQVSLEYNKRRASYRRQVSELRKIYLQDYQRQLDQDQARKKEEQAQQLRRRLERQRAKNERSAINARRQEELRRQARLAFQDHLLQQQQLRDVKNELKRRARQLLLEELEEEAPLWMTTREEVDAAFTTEAQQLLWGRPQGLIGVPNPSLDCHFWMYQGHTWDMSRTYQTQGQLLLEDFQDEAYQRTNLDPSVWTLERMQQQHDLEQKAKLRAMVRQEGRKALLMRQKKFLETDHTVQEGEPPKPMPIPSLGVLANIHAQEKEGVDLLLKDPTQFFVFDYNNNNNSNTSTTTTTTNDTTTDNQSAEASSSSSWLSVSYQGPTLGTPIRLKDPLRDPNGGRVFPIGIGKLPKADTRTEKEKKRQEREERLWAAAQQQAQTGDKEENLEMLIPEEDRVYGEAIDYNNNDDWDSDDEEWEKGLDRETDSEVWNVPREFRYREQDIEFVIKQLEQKARTMQSHVRNTIQTIEQDARSRLDRVTQEVPSVMAVGTEQGIGGADQVTTTAHHDGGEPFFDALTTEKLRQIGADVTKYEQLMASFSHDQLLSLFGLNAQRHQDDTSNTVDDDNTKMSSLEDGATGSSSIFESIPNITKEQVIGLTELESFMKVLENSSSILENEA